MAQETIGDAEASLEEQIIATASSGTQKLPMLDVIFSGVASSLTSSLKGNMGLLAEVEFGEISYLSWGKGVGTLDPHEICVISMAEPWDTRFILAIDPALFYGIYEVQLNGSGIPETYPKRQPSTAEKRVAKRFGQVFLDEVSSNFNRVSSVQFVAEHVETTQQAASMQSAHSSCVIAEITLRIEHLKGRLRVIFPISALDPVQKQLSKMFLGDNFEGDANWRTLLERRVNESHVDIEAVLCSKHFLVSEILGWKPGTVIDMGRNPEEVTVSCASIPILAASTGHRKKHRAIQITRDYDDQSHRDEDGMEFADLRVEEQA